MSSLEMSERKRQQVQITVWHILSEQLKAVCKGNTITFTAFVNSIKRSGMNFRHLICDEKDVIRIVVGTFTVIHVFGEYGSNVYLNNPFCPVHVRITGNNVEMYFRLLQELEDLEPVIYEETVSLIEEAKGVVDNMESTLEHMQSVLKKEFSGIDVLQFIRYDGLEICNEPSIGESSLYFCFDFIGADISVLAFSQETTNRIKRRIPVNRVDECLPEFISKVKNELFGMNI